MLPYTAVSYYYHYYYYYNVLLLLLLLLLQLVLLPWSHLNKAKNASIGPPPSF